MTGPDEESERQLLLLAQAVGEAEARRLLLAWTEQSVSSPITIGEIVDRGVAWALAGHRAARNPPDGKARG